MRTVEKIKANCALAREPKHESIGIYRAPLGDIIITKEKSSGQYSYDGVELSACDIKGASATELLCLARRLNDN